MKDYPILVLAIPKGSSEENTSQSYEYLTIEYHKTEGGKVVYLGWYGVASYYVFLTEEYFNDAGRMNRWENVEVVRNQPSDITEGAMENASVPDAQVGPVSVPVMQVIRLQDHHRTIQDQIRFCDDTIGSLSREREHLEGEAFALRTQILDLANSIPHQF